jgi:hypothetical protein
MKLIDMKRAPAQSKEPAKLAQDPYDYAHRVRLEGEHIKKLGADKLDVGDECMIHGHCKVVSKSSHEHEQGDEHSAVELQIIKMGLGSVEQEKEDEVKSAPESMKDYAKRRNAELRER